MRKNLFVTIGLGVFFALLLWVADIITFPLVVLPAYIFFLILELADVFGNQLMGMISRSKKSDFTLKVLALLLFGIFLTAIIALTRLSSLVGTANDLKLAWLCLSGAVVGTVALFAVRKKFTVEKDCIFLLDGRVLWQEGEDVSLPFYSDLPNRIQLIKRYRYIDCVVDCELAGDDYRAALCYKLEFDLSKLVAAGHLVYWQLLLALPVYLADVLKSVDDDSPSQEDCCRWDSFNKFYATISGLSEIETTKREGRHYVKVETSGEQVDIMNFVKELKFHSMLLTRK